MPSHALLKSALAAFLLLAAGASHAQPYWRLDLGYSMSTDANIRDNNFARDGFICATAACTTGGELNEIGNSPVVQGGFGWRFSPNFRIDGTLGYRGFYELDDSDAFPSNFKADISSLALMGNAYYDFSLTWGKPYVGAGIGLAMNRIDNITNTGGALGTVSFSLPGGTTTDLAWAIMAGVAIPISSSLTLDVGYRYIDLGKIESDPGTGTVNVGGTFTYSGLSGKLRAHELMVGLRF